MKTSYRHPCHRRCRLFPLAAILLATLVAATGPVDSLHAAERVVASKPLPRLAFALKDQFGREYTEAYCAGKTSILMIYDREGGRFGFTWGPAIGRELKAATHLPTQWINVTTLTFVPSFLRGTAAKYLSKDPAQWTLLDFRGHLASTYGVRANHLGILVCGPDGEVVCCQSVRELDPAVVSSIVAAIVRTGATRPPANTPQR